MYNSRLSVLKLSLLFLIVFVLSSCTTGPVAGEVVYQAPFLPLEIGLNTRGEISLNVSQSTSIVTPIGVFELGLVADPMSYFDTIESALVIRLGEQECFYDLHGETNLKIDVSEEDFRLLSLEQNGGITKVHLEGNGRINCQHGDVLYKESDGASFKQSTSLSSQEVAAIVNSCEGASPSGLNVGMEAVITVAQAAVHVNPNEFPPLVRNKYLAQGRTVTVLEGPVCGKGNPGQAIFWRVQSEEVTFSSGARGRVIGWIAEESGNVYLMQSK